MYHQEPLFWTLGKAVHIRFYEYLNASKLLVDKQHGFRPHHSTVSALSNFADEILCNMEKGKLCGAVFLDLSKAFDTVNHTILLSKLSAVGVCNDDLAWFKSYLSSRLLRTSCGPELSDPLECNLGVPLGIILGPLLFIVYINDLRNVVEHAQVSLYTCHQIPRGGGPRGNMGTLTIMPFNVPTFFPLVL